MSARRKPAPRGKGGAGSVIGRQCFHEHEHSLPIGGTPKPVPCPFCGSDQIAIVLEPATDAELPSSHAQCEFCGAEAGYDVCETAEGSYWGSALRAALFWNRRAGKGRKP
jgi:hypothetical protein